VPEESKRSKSSINPEQEFKILNEISSLVQHSEAHTDSLEKILKCLGKIVDFRSASLYLISDENGQLEEVCTVGRKVDLIDFVSFDMGSGISAWVAKHKRPIVLNNLRKSRGGTHTKSFLSVPLIFGGKVTGVINLAHDEPDSFTRRDTETVATASSIIGLLLERILHQEIIAKMTKEFETLKEDFKQAKRRQEEAEQFLSFEGMAALLHKKINNPLSIITGNAQFLLMTLKNSPSSVIKRLQAIDKETSLIATFLQSLLKTTGTASTSSFPVSKTQRNPEDCQAFLQN
jgi:transcriptional regulator with GAF, ATPase, and Fis domain